MKLKCDEDWKFQGNEEVIFENCTVVGGASSLYLNGCRHVEFNGCKFLDFTRPVLFEEGEGEVVIENCEFENCSVEYNYAYSPSWWTFSAGVIITSGNGDNSIRNKIVNSDFRNCEVRNMDVRKGENIISDCECVVKNNRFYKCKSWFKRESRYLTEYTEARMFSNCIERENNQLVDSAKFLG